MDLKIAEDRERQVNKKGSKMEITKKERERENA